MIMMILPILCGLLKTKRGYSEGKALSAPEGLNKACGLARHHSRTPSKNGRFCEAGRKIYGYSMLFPKNGDKLLLWSYMDVYGHGSHHTFKQNFCLDHEHPFDSYLTMFPFWVHDFLWSVVSISSGASLAKKLSDLWRRDLRLDIPMWGSPPFSTLS